MIQLTKRMQAVADLVTPGLPVADIGCDHGYLSIYLVQQGIAPSIIAMDVNKGPLEAAKSHVQACQLEDKIKLRLSDGLKNLEDNEAKSVVVAGMGGRLVLKIVSEGEAFWKDTTNPVLKEFILQPQSEQEYFRKTMNSYGFECIAEDMVFEDGKYYPMGKYVYKETVAPLSEVEARYGKHLLDNQHPVLKQYLEFEKTNLEKIQSSLKFIKDSNKRVERSQEVEYNLDINQTALERMKVCQNQLQ